MYDLTLILLAFDKCLQTGKNVGKAVQVLNLSNCCVFILSAISPYTTGLKALFNPSDCTGTAPTHK